MGKNLFLNHFQENLGKSIESLIKNTWGREEYKVTSEYRDLKGHFKGIIDIAIVNIESENSILSIEIEHRSSFEQAKRNIEKMKNWTHNSTYRRCSFLQIFNEESNISIYKMDDLVEYAKMLEKEAKGFNYDFIFYGIADKRKCKQIAEDLVYSMDFQTRLWLLMGLSKMQ